MKTVPTLFLFDLYTNYLSKIREIHFTPREIDVIACLLNGRRPAMIARLLTDATPRSITPKTITDHIANIKNKIECNAIEEIISFIEGSDRVLFLRKYYETLQILAFFRKSLKAIFGKKLNSRNWNNQQAETHLICCFLNK